MPALAGPGIAVTRAGFPVVCTVIVFLLGKMFGTSPRLFEADGMAVPKSPSAAVFLLLAAAVVLRAAWRSTTPA